MAAYNYKWLAAFLFLPFAAVPVGKDAVRPAADAHPFHVSTTEITHNAAERSLEISCRLFTDDFEAVLAKIYKTKTDFSDAALKSTMDELVKKYVLLHLQVSADGQPAALNVLGWESESEAIYVYLEATGIGRVQKIEVTDTILYDHFDDQLNIVHVIVGGKRKSAKLNYPEKKTVLSF